MNKEHRSLIDQASHIRKMKNWLPNQLAFVDSLLLQLLLIVTNRVDHGLIIFYRHDPAGLHLFSSIDVIGHFIANNQIVFGRLFDE